LHPRSASAVPRNRETCWYRGEGSGLCAPGAAGIPRVAGLCRRPGKHGQDPLSGTPPAAPPGVLE